MKTLKNEYMEEEKDEANSIQNEFELKSIKSSDSIGLDDSFNRRNEGVIEFGYNDDMSDLTSRNQKIISRRSSSCDESSNFEEIFEINDNKRLIVAKDGVKFETLSLLNIYGKVILFWPLSLVITMVTLGITPIVIFIALLIACIACLVNELLYFTYKNMNDYLRLNILIFSYMIVIMIVRLAASKSLNIIDQLLWPSDYNENSMFLYVNEILDDGQ
ncbi:hypothetical protein EDEG_01324 [Edhazardia aedis USNM 41457]|uniref:Uncharacterized protein n=1 Tax=Edhazardia aedis (strain USNM 41457) TaxID=1003232 RepID=J9DAB9_EDHAE|nr:hypothetical protein EDEG_01324 [Edhazardia aedis USNM 41457]|eukprot:EJW04454.1 hypothetical protein EDEG_01324 [Edhazardia aedis USNM 41457]